MSNYQRVLAKNLLVDTSWLMTLMIVYGSYGLISGSCWLALMRQNRWDWSAWPHGWSKLWHPGEHPNSWKGPTWISMTRNDLEHSMAIHVLAITSSRPNAPLQLPCAAEFAWNLRSHPQWHVDPVATPSSRCVHWQQRGETTGCPSDLMRAYQTESSVTVRARLVDVPPAPPSAPDLSGPCQAERHLSCLPSATSSWAEWSASLTFRSLGLLPCDWLGGP